MKIKSKVTAAFISLAVFAGAASQFVSPLKKQNDNAVIASAAEKADWLSVKGNKIVDAEGREVWLTGVNWFGFNTQRRTFDGLWTSSLYDDLRLIADHGMNLLRVPIAAELVLNWRAGKTEALTWEFSQTYNEKELNDLGIQVDFAKPTHPSDLDVFNLTLKYCREMGLKVMLDIHSNEISDNGHQHPVWYTDKFGVETYYNALEWLAATYKNDDTLIAIDLKNEPHGKKTDALYAKWDNSTDANNWKYIAEVAGKKVLDINPNVLIMVEGIEVYPKEGQTWDSPAGGYGQPENFYGAWWGGNFRGVKDYPVNLGKYQNKLVYSPHDYGPSVYPQSWFYEGFTRQSVHDDYWYDSWAYIYEDGEASYTAPLLIGEWGGFVEGDLDERAKSGENTAANTKWLKFMQEYIIENRIHHTFWCFNYNSSDTGGLMYNDFHDWNEPKYQFLEPALWKAELTHKDAGKYVGLDHDVPLGNSGISLDQYYGGAGDTPVTSTTKVATTVVTTTAGTAAPTSATKLSTGSSTTLKSDVVTSPVDTSALYGDVDENKVVELNDIVLLAKYLGRNAELSEQSLKNANCDRTSSSVNVLDLLAIIKYVFGEIETLPI